MQKGRTTQPFPAGMSLFKTKTNAYCSIIKLFSIFAPSNYTAPIAQKEFENMFMFFKKSGIVIQTDIGRLCPTQIVLCNL